jgi:hypothetical protein
LSYVTANPRELEAWLKLLYIRTENMFSNPDVWRAVKLLAAELMQRKTILGKEATEIIVAGFNESFYSQHPEIRSQEVALAARLKTRSQELKRLATDKNANPEA